jgi:hypothetical protein
MPYHNSGRVPAIVGYEVSPRAVDIGRLVVFGVADYLPVAVFASI